jgi:plastocyanin
MGRNPPKQNLTLRLLLIALVAGGCIAFIPVRARPATSPANNPPVIKLPHGFFLPGPGAAQIVTVARSGHAEASILVMTEAVAVKETGPKATVKKFGETYAFSPAFIALRRGEPTAVTFWNLQPDDEHDFALLDHGKVLMYVMLAPLSRITYIFDFHQEGIFEFKCLRHQPEMSGQILVVGP